MRRFLGKMLALALSCPILSTSIAANPLDDALREKATYMNSLVGKTFWIEKPNGKGIAFCQKQNSVNCPYIFSTSLEVLEAFAKNDRWKVRLPNGNAGFIHYENFDRLLSRPLAAEDRQINDKCEREGPSVGMTQDQIFVCLGVPIKTLTTKTAAGTVEQLFYGQRGYVYIEDGKVTAVQTAR